MTANNISLTFAIAESFILVSQFFNVLLRKQDKSRLRFLILVASFVVFNLLYVLIPDLLGSNNLKSKLFIHLSGYLVATAYLIYVLREYKIFETITSSRNLLYGVTITMITSYLTSFFLLGSFEIAKTMFVILPILGSVSTCIYVQVQFKRNKEKEQSSFFLFTTYFGIVLMASIPLIVHLNACSEINISMINISFMLLAAGYFYQLSSNHKKEFQALTDYGFYTDVSELEKFNLTERELEVAQLMLEGKSFKEIGAMFFITPKTATKHGSNIYKRVGCGSKKEFLKMYKKPTIKH